MDLDDADAWQTVFTLPTLMTDEEQAMVEELTSNMRAAEQASLEDLANMDPGELLDDPADAAAAAAAPVLALDDFIANFQPVGSPVAISTPRSTPRPSPPPPPSTPPPQTRRRPRTARRPPTRQQEVADLTSEYADLERRLFDMDNVPSSENTRRLQERMTWIENRLVELNVDRSRPADRRRETVRRRGSNQETIAATTRERMGPGDHRTTTTTRTTTTMRKGKRPTVHRSSNSVSASLEDDDNDTSRSSSSSSRQSGGSVHDTIEALRREYMKRRYRRKKAYLRKTPPPSPSKEGEEEETQMGDAQAGGALPSGEMDRLLRTMAMRQQEGKTPYTDPLIELDDQIRAVATSPRLDQRTRLKLLETQLVQYRNLMRRSRQYARPDVGSTQRPSAMPRSTPTMSASPLATPQESRISRPPPQARSLPPSYSSLTYSPYVGSPLSTKVQGMKERLLELKKKELAELKKRSTGFEYDMGKRRKKGTRIPAPTFETTPRKTRQGTIYGFGKKKKKKTGKADIAKLYADAYGPEWKKVRFARR
ncbi:hypothetical protein AC249_AIPGENE21534 [Exaiptasia diaphana]|nr:hypothetical protein AC249_AIPGENE21534 [Exaiptasia diaphana]